MTGLVDILSAVQLNRTSFSTLQHTFFLCSSPALSEQDFEAIGAAFRKRQLQAVVSNAPYDSGRVHVFIRDLTGQHLPQHHPERPADATYHITDRCVHLLDFTVHGGSMAMDISNRITYLIMNKLL